MAGESRRKDAVACQVERGAARSAEMGGETAGKGMG